MNAPLTLPFACAHGSLPLPVGEGRYAAVSLSLGRGWREAPGEGMSHA